MPAAVLHLNTETGWRGGEAQTWFLARGHASIVASAIDGVDEILDDARHGLLVPPGSAAALAAAIRTLLEDRALAARLREAARSRASDFGIERMISRTVAVYHALGEFPCAS